MGKPVITPEKARAIYLDTGTFTQIGARHGVSVSMVGGIKTGRSWSEATGATYRPPAGRKVSPEIRAAVLASTDTQRNTALRLGIPINAVRMCIYEARRIAIAREAWKDVPANLGTPPDFDKMENA